MVLLHGNTSKATHNCDVMTSHMINEFSSIIILETLKINDLELSTLMASSKISIEYERGKIKLGAKDLNRRIQIDEGFKYIKIFI